MPTRLISVAFAQSIPSICTKHGANPAKLFSSAGLDMNSVGVPGASFTVSHYNGLLKHCAYQIKKPNFGLLVGSSLRPQMLGAFGLRLQYCQTIGEGINFFQNNFQRVQQAAALSLVPMGRTYILKIQIVDPDVTDPDQLVQSFLALLVGWIRRRYRESWEPIKVYLKATSTETMSEVRNYFRCPAMENASFYGLEFTRETFEASLKGGDPVLCALLESHLDSHGDLSSVEQNLKFTVANAIEKNLEEKKTTIDTVARQLGFSARTLQRRLVEEDIKFSVLVSDVRRALARRLLRQQAVSISEVAFRLGYSDVSSFSRAFQRWEGVPPSQY